MEMNEEKKYHLIDQYLNGELTGRSLDNFKAMLKDPEFAKQVEIQRQIMEVIKEERKSELKKLMSESSKVHYFQNSWGNTWTYASAAIVVLFVSAFFILKKFGTTDTPTNTVTLEPKEETNATDMDTTKVDSNLVAIETPTPGQTDNTAPDIAEETISEEEAVEAELDEDLDIMSDEPEAHTLEENDAVTPASADGIPEVKKDEILSGKRFTVVQMKPDFEATREKATEGADSAASDIKYKEINRRSLNVEFWESPVGFKGYKYTSEKLILYDIDENAALSFKELDSRLYLSLGGKYYHLEKNGTYNKFVAVTNKTLLKVLND